MKFNPDRLIAIIECNHTTVPAVAKDIGVSRQIVHCWTTGKQVPKLKSLMDICEKFKVPIGYFFPTGKAPKPGRKRQAALV